MARATRQPKHMYDHFSEVAALYNDIRTTDLEPVIYIKKKLGGRNSIEAADIGCGGGRYSLLLFQHLAALHLTCNDVNASMLAETARYLEHNGIKDFSTVQSDIANLPLADNSLDCIFTFNAIHHFDPLMFLEKAAKALRTSSYVFIYARLQSQNARNIWGRFFPGFRDKENRLYSLAQIENWADSCTALTLESIGFFKFKRRSTLSQLVRQAESKHYSTFSLYSASEFDRALKAFQQKIKRRFADPDRVEWFDENVMVVFRKD